MQDVDERSIPAIPDQVEPFIIGLGWVCAMTNGVVVQTKGTAERVPIEMQVYATDLCARLNREVSHDGGWVVGWTDFSSEDGFPKRLMMGYRDKDGDLLFMVDAEDPFLFMVSYVDDYVEQCSEAFAVTQAHLKDVGVKQDQKIKAALGQESADPDAFGGEIINAI